MTRRFRGIPAAPILVFTLAALAGCATAPRGADKEAKPADMDALKDIGGKANALVVFASSRAGGSHLFTMRSDGSETKQLTKGALTEWNPRFSPDGSRILFSRSVAKGAREVDAGADRAWELFTVKPDGSEAIKVAENATWGSWISNDEILFLRGQKIMRMKLGGEEEAKKVMDLSRHSVFDGSVVRGPELSRDGHEIAMTIVGAHRQVGIWSLKKKAWTQVGAGSQVTWFPDGSSLAWVNPSGKGLSEIVRTPGAKSAPAKTTTEEATEGEETEEAEETPEKGPAKLVDLQGKRTHEASPRLSADGKWLVFAAAIGSAEPDLEDYELYLWEVGSNDSPTRLTFHSASDRSPDIFVGAGAPKGEAEAPAAGAPEGDGEKPEADKAEKPESASEPAETEKKEEPAATDTAEPPSDENEAAPTSGKAKAKPKAKAAKKKKR